MVLGSHLN